MSGGRRGPRSGSDAAAAGSGVRSYCATALAIVALAAAAAIAFLESATAGGVSYTGEGWLHECAKWDAEGRRFLLTTFLGAGVVEVREGAGKVEERVVVADPDVAGRLAVGLALDAPRRRFLVTYADRPPRFRFAAVGAYELGSGRRLFLARLDGPGESSFADDVAADEDGNAYVTDVMNSKIWKVSPAGEPLGTITNATFMQRPGARNNIFGLNGIIYHPSGYLLVVHTTGGDLFKVDPRTGAVSVVKVLAGSLKRGDGLELLSPTTLAVAGVPTRMVESADDWETARVTARYVGPAHRIGTSATVKDGDVYVNHVFGFGLGRKKTHVIAKAVFSPL